MPNDEDLLEALRTFVVTQQIQTPKQLFQILELHTHHSPLASPTEAVSKVWFPLPRLETPQYHSARLANNTSNTRFPHNRIIKHH